MSSGTTLTTREKIICTAALAFGALALYLWYLHRADPPDSPILVRDGSLILESSPNYPFVPTYWLVPDIDGQPSHWLVHQKSNWKLKHYSKRGDTKLRKCRGGKCKLVVTLNDSPPSTVIFETQNNGKGLSIYSSVDYKSDLWNRSDPRVWVLGNASLKIKDIKMTGTNKDDGTAEDPDKLLCEGSNCGEVRVHFEQ